MDTPKASNVCPSLARFRGDRRPGSPRAHASAPSVEEPCPNPAPGQRGRLLLWPEYAQMSDSELAKHDVATINLSCASDLPGAPHINVERSQATLAAWAEQVRLKTYLGFRRFRQHPARWEGSSALFRVHCLVSILQLDFGVRYNSDKMAPDATLCSEDVFVHGVLQGGGGTCASLPVVYVAVGRRLGYPLRLVCALGPACGHRFLRWETPRGERFNIKINNQGFDAPSDDYYGQGPYAATRQWETTVPLLQSLGPRQELACFLADRGGLLLQAGNHDDALHAFRQALVLDPGNALHSLSLQAARNDVSTDCTAELG
jgi:hypothetical protein